MRSTVLLRLLLVPSLFSGVIVSGVALVVLGYSAWHFIAENQLFYTYLFGAYGFQTFFGKATEHLSWDAAFLGSAAAYYILIAAIAVLAGLVVYTALQSIGFLLKTSAQTWRELHGPQATRRAVIDEELGRLGLRMVGIAGWTAYAVFFVSTLLPFTLLLTTLGVAQLQAGSWIGGVQVAAAVGLLAVAMHVHVIFARLCWLRPRLVGGDAAIEEAEARR